MAGLPAPGSAVVSAVVALALLVAVLVVVLVVVLVDGDVVTDDVLGS
jgi:hypothetical protein